MSEIRKQKIIKREKLTWAPPCAAQPAGRPSQQAAQPTTAALRRLPPLAPKLLRARTRTAARPPPACRRPPGRVDDACSPSRSPLLFLTLPGSLLPLPRSLSHTAEHHRRRRSP